MEPHKIHLDNTKELYKKKLPVLISVTGTHFRIEETQLTITKQPNIQSIRLFPLMIKVTTR